MVTAMTLATKYKAKSYNTSVSNNSIEVSVNGKSPKQILSNKEKPSEMDEYVFSLISEIARLKYELYGIEAKI